MATTRYSVLVFIVLVISVSRNLISHDNGGDGPRPTASVEPEAENQKPVCEPAEKEATLTGVNTPFITFKLAAPNGISTNIPPCMSTVVSKEPVKNNPDKCVFSLITQNQCLPADSDLKKIDSLFLKTKFGEIPITSKNIIRRDDAEVNGSKSTTALIFFQSPCTTVETKNIKSFSDKTLNPDSTAQIIKHPLEVKTGLEKKGAFPEGPQHQVIEVKTASPISPDGLQGAKFDPAGPDPFSTPGGAVLIDGEVAGLCVALKEGSSGVAIFDTKGTQWAKKVLATCYPKASTPPQARPTARPTPPSTPPQARPTPQIPPPDSSATQPPPPDSTTPDKRPNPRTQGLPLEEFLKVVSGSKHLIKLGLPSLTWSKNGMCGKAINGNWLPLFIDDNTGQLLGGPQNELPVARETKLELGVYYKDPRLRSTLTQPELRLADLFLKTI